MEFGNVSLIAQKLMHVIDVFCMAAPSNMSTNVQVDIDDFEGTLSQLTSPAMWKHLN